MPDHVDDDDHEEEGDEDDNDNDKEEDEDERRRMRIMLMMIMSSTSSSLDDRNSSCATFSFRQAIWGGDVDLTSYLSILVHRHTI